MPRFPGFSTQTAAIGNQQAQTQKSSEDRRRALDQRLALGLPKLLADVGLGVGGLAVRGQEAKARLAQSKNYFDQREKAQEYREKRDTLEDEQQAARDALERWAREDRESTRQKERAEDIAREEARHKERMALPSGSVEALMARMMEAQLADIFQNPWATPEQKSAALAAAAESKPMPSTVSDLPAFTSAMTAIAEDPLYSSMFDPNIVKTPAAARSLLQEQTPENLQNLAMLAAAMQRNQGEAARPALRGLLQGQPPLQAPEPLPPYTPKPVLSYKDLPHPSPMIHKGREEKKIQERENLIRAIQLLSRYQQDPNMMGPRQPTELFPLELERALLGQ